MKILIAVNGTPESDAAVETLGNRPWPGGTAVEVLAVVHAGGPMWPDPAFVMAAVHQERTHILDHRAHEWVSSAADRIRRAVPDAVVTTKVIEGLPKDVIVREAHESSADLILLGCGAHGALHRAVHGSLAGAVVAHAPCSVEVVCGHAA